MLIRSQGTFKAVCRRLLILLSALLVLAGCGGDSRSEDFYPVDRETFERVVAELDGRSFRQFDPSLDASPRRAVVLDFFDGVSMHAQFAQDDHAVYEWEISAGDYRIEWTGDASEIVLIPVRVTSVREFPRPSCSDCIAASGVSISIRNVFDPDDMAFRVNDPNDILPLPFPVFDSWTRFNEDEYVDSEG